jgi:hypothetical protein
VVDKWWISPIYPIFMPFLKDLFDRYFEKPVIENVVLAH